MPDLEPDRICIRDLSISTHIGVPELERASLQRLCLDLEMTPKNSWRNQPDTIEGTIDYAQVAEKIRQLAQDQECQLIETLAEKIASLVLKDFPVATVILELKKFILPDCRCVSVKIARPH